jgi:hypothetical protein
MAAGFPVKANYATGDVLTATNMNDLSGSVNLLQSAQSAAGKNAIINGAFNVWQRGTTFTSPANGTFTADRFKYLKDGTGTCTVSQQTFTPGTAPVAGYESAYFLRNAGTALGTSTNFDIQQNIEDVRTFAGQTVTVSFYAKADSARTLTLYVGQDFGSGGSGTAYPLGGQTFTLTTSWVRYSATFTMTSISGKTIGTSSYLFLLFRNAASASLVFDLWGVQLEASSTASTFQTATGTIQGELAACQRYYYRQTGSGNTATYNLGTAYSTTKAFVNIIHPVSMRIVPTAIEVPSTITNLKLTNIAANNYTISGITFVEGTYTNTILEVTSSGMTANQGVWIGNNSTTAGFIGVSAEL